MGYSPSSGQGTTAKPNLWGRRLLVIPLWFNKIPGKIPDPVVNYTCSWWPLLKLLFADQLRDAWNRNFHLKRWFLDHWLLWMYWLWDLRRGERWSCTAFYSKEEYGGELNRFTDSSPVGSVLLCSLLHVSECSCHQGNLICTGGTDAGWNLAHTFPKFAFVWWKLIPSASVSCCMKSWDQYAWTDWYM